MSEQSYTENVALDSKRQAWDCKIGVVGGVHIPPGGDAPMREAVRQAFIDVTGAEPEAIFSGWGAEFTPQEQAVIRNDGSWPEAPATYPSESVIGLLIRAKSAIEQCAPQRFSGVVIDIEKYLAAAGAQ